MNRREVFIVGSKGIPAQYGGFETFVENLTYYRDSSQLHYHVACIGKQSDGCREYEYNGARCFCVPVPEIGAAKAVLYDMKALEQVLQYVKENHIQNPVIYILACRIGPFIKSYKQKIKRLGGTLILNPDGHEWKRAKWNWIIKKYWKYSERMMVRVADMVICDSRNIEEYIHSEYEAFQPNTRFIAYGSEIEDSVLDDDKGFESWCSKYGIVKDHYYLVVGRFVPENNYETIIREFMRTKVNKDLLFITNIQESKFYRQLKKKTGFETDSRIKFVGTVYEKELLKKIRKNAFGYIHGHEVGGTNPSLLEALASTKVNLLLDVGFNREVAENSALYWTKEEGVLSDLMIWLEGVTEHERDALGQAAKDRITSEYNWKSIVKSYENVFLKEIEYGRDV